MLKSRRREELPLISGHYAMRMGGIPYAFARPRLVLKEDIHRPDCDCAKPRTGKFGVAIATIKVVTM